MFNRVLVGIDEESEGRDAIALACLLASPGSDITFGHVQPATPHTRYYLNPQETRPDAGDPTREMLAAAAERSGLDAWIRTVSSTNVAVGLVAIAREVDADLIVVGTTDRSRLTRALLGNPTTKTMASADCVVAVAPQGYADGAHEIRRIGVAYDGSAASESALALARQLSAETHAEVSAFAVVPGPHEGPSLRRHHMERAVLALKEANVHMAQQDNVESLIAYGDPVEQLGGFSGSVDVLIAGSRGAGPVARMLRPSTTAALTGAVACPLLVVTKGARSKQGITPLSSVPTAAPASPRPEASAPPQGVGQHIAAMTSDDVSSSPFPGLGSPPPQGPFHT